LTVEPVDVRVQRWPDAMPQYGPGHGDLIAELRAGPARRRWRWAGGYLNGIGVARVHRRGPAEAATDAIRAVETPVAR